MWFGMDDGCGLDNGEHVCLAFHAHAAIHLDVQ